MPARTADSGVPPTATQIGSGSWTGRGYTPWPRLRDQARALAHVQQQLELLGEELVVVVEVVAEQRERLDERASAGHDLRTAAREEVERREVLEHADGVVRAEDGHRARQPDALRPRRGCGEHDRRRRHGEVRPVVLADPEDVEADLVRELDLLHEVAQPLLGALLALARVREREDADLHDRVVPVGSVQPRRRTAAVIASALPAANSTPIPRSPIPIHSAESSSPR